MEKTNKKISLIITIVFIVSLFIGVILLTYSKYLKNNNIYEEENNNKPTIISKDISMNLEQTAGAGDYKTVTQSNWPTEGYKFNAELSRCENESEISWADTKKAVIVSGNLSDKCYVYFDIWIPTIADYCTSGTDLATCVKNFGDQGGDVSNIYIHDSSLTNGAGDNSYRYAGPSESVNNFVCFGTNESPCPTDNLYRIIGVIDGKVKLIKYDYNTKEQLGTAGNYSSSYTPSKSYKGDLTTVDLYYWDFSTFKNIWSESLLNKTNLNANFINNIGTTWANKISTTTWKVGGNTEANIVQLSPSKTYTNEITNPAESTTYNAKIGLMYVSDYGFAASPNAWTSTMETYNNTTVTSNNWMFIGYSDWTISRNSATSDYTFCVLDQGQIYSNTVINIRGVRATFFLEPTVTYVSGTGTSSDPIIIN